MSSRKRKLEISFALFVQLATWSIIVSFPEKSDQLSPWDGNSDRYGSYTTGGPYLNSYTSSEDRDKYKSRSIATSPLFWGLVIGGFLLALLIVLIKYLCKCYDRDTEDSPATLHPPPVRIVPPPNRSMQSFGAQNTISSDTFFSGTSYSFPTQNYTGVSSTQNYTGISTGVPSMHNASDRPPGYFAVVSDSGEGRTKFPEVSQKLLDTATLKYED